MSNEMNAPNADNRDLVEERDEIAILFDTIEEQLANGQETEMDTLDRALGPEKVDDTDEGGRQNERIVDNLGRGGMFAAYEPTLRRGWVDNKGTFVPFE